MKTILISIFTLVFITQGCVKKSKYQKQVNLYRQLKKNFNTLEQQSEACKKSLKLKNADFKRISDNFENLKSRHSNLQKKLSGVEGKAGKLKEELKHTSDKLTELAKAKKEAEKRARTLKELTDKFRSLIDAGDLEVINRNGRLVIKLKAAILFGSGSASVKSIGKKALRNVAKVLKKMDKKHFQIAGHTDDEPINSKKFKNNWLLSAYRAVNVVRVLQRAGVPGKMLSAAGYSKYQPLKPNKTEENKKFNRRIEIQIIPEIPSFLQK
ncbi:MAG: OmpA family protein [Myxococcota bacterium]